MKHSAERYFLASSRYFRFSFLIAARVCDGGDAWIGAIGQGAARWGRARARRRAFWRRPQRALAMQAVAARTSGAPAHGMQVTYLPATGSRAAAQSTAPGARPFRGAVASRTPIAGNFFRATYEASQSERVFSASKRLLPVWIWLRLDAGRRIVMATKTTATRITTATHCKAPVLAVMYRTISSQRKTLRGRW